METLIVGDEFISAAAFREAIEDELGGDFGPVRDVDWGGDDDQHAAQQIMERDGVEAVPAQQHVVDAVGDAEVLAVHFAPVTEALLDAGPKLRAVVVARAGTENVNVEAASARNVAVVNVLGRNAAAVSEQALGLALAELRDIARKHAGIRQGDWPERSAVPAVELGGRPVGIIGLGHVGRQTARRLSGFGVRLLVHDPYVDDETIAALGGERSDGLDAIFREADVIFLHARLTEETRRFIGREQFALMKPEAYFVNTARSRLVDYDALYEVLAEKRIAGAGLDVHDDEPLERESAWRELDNVTLSPHVAGSTRESWQNSVRMVAEAIGDLDAGRQPDTTVNAGALAEATAGAGR